MRILINAVLVAVGMLLAAMCPVAVEKMFTQRQMATSPFPLLIDMTGPFLTSVVVTVLAPKPNPILITWIALGTAAFALGDIIAIFHVRHGDANLWPIEIVISTGLAAGALCAGSIAGRFAQSTLERRYAR